MTPAARVASAIEVLDAIDEGAPAERALTNWARANRYAGSKDRAAVRDHVFDVLRKFRSTAAAGGAKTGRGRMIGALRLEGLDPEETFNGAGYGPSDLTEAEAAHDIVVSDADMLDLPDWIFARLEADHGAQAEAIAGVLRQRAPVTVRVNAARATRMQARAQLSGDGISSVEVKDVATALMITGNPRRVVQSEAYTHGNVELQDAASQAAILAIDLPDAARVLDYCAGGGGKALALAARAPDSKITAHDAEKSRMSDLAARAERAGVDIAQTLAPEGVFDVVLVDAPCSGSGTWRRAPQAKWILTEKSLQDYGALQLEILRKAASHVGENASLVYMTCSVFSAENQEVVETFQDEFPAFSLTQARQWLPSESQDGFFLAEFRLKSSS